VSNESLTWLLTSTTYGTWLPGDDRGFVGRVRERRVSDQVTDGLRIEHDVFETPYDHGMPGLQASASGRMKGTPVLFESDKAAAVLSQFQTTAA
jgi:hypothetical protein